MSHITNKKRIIAAIFLVTVFLFAVFIKIGFPAPTSTVSSVYSELLGACNSPGVKITRAWSAIKSAFYIGEVSAEETERDFCAEITASASKLISLRSQIFAEKDITKLFDLYNSAMTEIRVLETIISDAGLGAHFGKLDAIREGLAAVEEAVNNIEIPDEVTCTNCDND